MLHPRIVTLHVLSRTRRRHGSTIYQLGHGSRVDTKIDSVPLMDVYRVCAKVSMMPRRCTVVKVYEAYFRVFLHSLTHKIHRLHKALTQRSPREFPRPHLPLPPAPALAQSPVPVPSPSPRSVCLAVFVSLSRALTLSPSHLWAPCWKVFQTQRSSEIWKFVKKLLAHRGGTPDAAAGRTHPRDTNAEVLLGVNPMSCWARRKLHLAQLLKKVRLGLRPEGRRRARLQRNVQGREASGAVSKAVR